RRQLELNDPDRRALLNHTHSRTADAFGYGSMGGFYTYNEIVNKLGEMVNDYPSLVDTFKIGTSHQGRTIWAFKISDNVTTDESSIEDVVYYDALHHAREPMSMACILNFSFWLLENYTTDSEVAYLVDNRELFFVPVVNPDGYVKNQSDQPNGGGLWRKNMKNAGGCSDYGVDLNRNYSYGWGMGIGSSNNPCNQTYRGTAAFSEVETQTIRDFTDSIEPAAVMTIHAVDGSVLMPYGFNSTGDDWPLYSELLFEMYDENDYVHGLIATLIGYFTEGTTRDYMHNKGRFAILPEIGGSGFWPLQSEIFPLVDENIKPMKLFAWFAGGMADLQSHSLKGQLVGGNAAKLEIEVKNKGLSSAANNVSVELLSNNPDVTIGNNNISYGNIASRSKTSNNGNLFELIVSNSITTGEEVEIEVVVKTDGVETDREVLTFHAGFKDVLFEDDAENGTGSWTAAGSPNTWGAHSDDAYSGNFSFSDSENGSENNISNRFQLNGSFDLTQTENPKVEFVAKWSLESLRDVARFQISTNGISWTSLPSDYTISASGAPGYTRNNSWAHVTTDLSNYTNQSNVRFRFFLATNNNRETDGFYFDDFSITDYRECPNIVGNKIYVDKDANGTGLGDSWTDAYNNLSIAFDVLECNANVNTVWLAEGNYKTDEVGNDRSAYFEIDQAYQIYGGFDGT
ncbi:MAG: M14 family metallopeptidase, partial [Bacteroidota bacterium]